MARGALKTANNPPKLAPPSPRNGNRLPVGNHPGNTGGKKGRSGRKPNDFLAWCKSLTDDDVARTIFAARNRAGDINVLKLAAEYAHGKPKQDVSHSGDVTIHVEFDE